MVGLAFRMLGPDRLCLVTDAIAAAGMEDGEYRLATRTVYADGGVPRLGSGAIAGSVLTMREAFRNILAFTGCTVPEAARMASTSPARLIGEGRRKGRLAPGYDADVTVLAPDLSVESRLAVAASWPTPGRADETRIRCRSTVECVRGDITSQDDVAAVVNAANARLEPGGGVAGAIHRAAGPGLAEEAVPARPHRARRGRHNRCARASEPLRHPHFGTRLRPGPSRGGATGGLLPQLPRARRGERA